MNISGTAVIQDDSGLTISFATRVERIERLGIDSYGPIAFARANLDSDGHRIPKTRRIWTMRPDGKDLRELALAKKITGIPSHPTWSPDGTRIAFGVLQGKPDKAQWSLWVQELANASAIQVASFSPGKGPIWQAAWSPDSTQIAFEHGTQEDPQRTREIFVVGVDGTAEPVQLTDTLKDNNHPTWSPDGSRIAFARQLNSVTPYQVMLMNFDGTDTEVLTLGSDPSWSPDGKSIAFALWGRTAKDPTNIHLIHLDQESKIRQLTSSPQDDLDPTWSPDGKKILFTRSRTGFGDDTDIWSMNADGTGEKKLTSPESDAFWAPTWRPSSSSSLPKFRFRHELTVPTTPVPRPGDNPLWTVTTEITASCDSNE